MKSNVLIRLVLLTALTGCASSHAPGSLQALTAELRQELMTQCMSPHTEGIVELASIDPTYVFRKCRQYTNSRIRRLSANR